MSLPGYIESPSRINETIGDISRWLLVAGVINLINMPLSGLLFFYMMPMMATTSFYPRFLIFIGLGIIGLFFELIAVIKLRGLRDITDEELFSIGTIFVIIGVIISITGFIILFLVMLPVLIVFTPSLHAYVLGNSAVYRFEFAFIFLVIMGIPGIIALIGRIILAVAFWRFGEMNHSDFMIVAGIIYIFLSAIGMILLGTILYGFRNRGRRFLSNESLLNIIKDRLARSPPNTSVDLKALAKQYNVPVFLLVSVVRYWIIMGEVEGIVSDSLFIAQRAGP